MNWKVKFRAVLWGELSKLDVGKVRECDCLDDAIEYIESIRKGLKTECGNGHLYFLDGDNLLAEIDVRIIGIL